MPSVKDRENAMATNVISGGADDSREPRPQPQPAGAARHGFFTIYKPGQGYWTRLGTGIGSALIILLTIQFFWTHLPPWIEQMVAPRGRPHSQGHGDQHRKHGAIYQKIERDDEAVGDKCRDRRLLHQRAPEVALQGISHEGEVLLPQRPIETEFGMQFGESLGRRPPHEHDLNGVARHEMNAEKAHQRHADEHGDQLHEAPDDETEHVPPS